MNRTERHAQLANQKLHIEGEENERGRFYTIHSHRSQSPAEEKAPGRQGMQTRGPGVGDRGRASKLVVSLRYAADCAAKIPSS